MKKDVRKKEKKKDRLKKDKKIKDAKNKKIKKKKPDSGKSEQTVIHKVEVQIRVCDDRSIDVLKIQPAVEAADDLHETIVQDVQRALEEYSERMCQEYSEKDKKGEADRLSKNGARIVGLHESTNKYANKWFTDEFTENNCATCRYGDRGEGSHPCRACLADRAGNDSKYSKWEPQAEKGKGEKPVQRLISIF